MRHDTKTPEQLRREIAYYAGIVKATKSRDRIERAHTAIRTRERALQHALKIRGALQEKEDHR